MITQGWVLTRRWVEMGAWVLTQWWVFTRRWVLTRSGCLRGGGCLGAYAEVGAYSGHAHVLLPRAIEPTHNLFLWVSATCTIVQFNQLKTVVLVYHLSVATRTTVPL